MSKKPKDNEVKKLTPEQLKKLRGGGSEPCAIDDTVAYSNCMRVHSACSNMSIGPSGAGKKKAPGSNS